VRRDAVPIERRAVCDRQGAIVIYPGEQFVIVFEIENGKIVSAVPNPAGDKSANRSRRAFKRDRQRHDAVAAEPFTPWM
jgi:hypothetical protein